jgi:uncharacterized membrane protein YeaQ/YmgE (transglycosylase-associated protein family)
MRAFDQGPSAQTRGETMNPVIWLVVGGFLGWLTSIELGPEGPQGRIVNIVVGAGGALVAGWFLSTSLGLEVVRSREISVGGLFEASFGAIVLLVLVNLIRLIRIP